MKWHQVIAVLFSIAVLAAGCGAGCGKEAKAPDDIAFYPVGDTAKEYDLERNGNGEFALCWKEEAAAGMDLCIDNQLTAVVHNVGESQLAMTQAYWYERLDGSRWEAWGAIRGQDDGLLWAAPGEAVAFGFDLETGEGDGALLEAGQYRVGKTVWPVQTGEGNRVREDDSLRGEGIPIYLEFRITKRGQLAMLEDSGQEAFLTWLEERGFLAPGSPAAIPVYTEKLGNYEVRDGILVLRDVGWDKTNALIWVVWNRDSQWAINMGGGARIQVYGEDGWEEAWNRISLNDVGYHLSPGGMFQEVMVLCDPDFSENGALPPGRYRLCKEVYGTRGKWWNPETSETFPLYLEFEISDPKNSPGGP